MGWEYRQLKGSFRLRENNYYSSFIAVADDCKATEAKIPKPRGTSKTGVEVQFEMMHQHPKKYTQEDVLFAIWRNRQDGESTSEELKIQRSEFFEKPQPCLRTSALAKTHGWGILFDKAGKTSLCAVESEEYRQHLNDSSLCQLKALSSKRVR